VPEERIAKLEQAFLEAMHSPAYLDYLKSVGLSEDSIQDREAWTEEFFGRMVPTVREMNRRLQETQ
jgi:ribonucleotide reductase beta subunit family protein with ferritin-like domain